MHNTNFPLFSLVVSGFYKAAIVMQAYYSKVCSEQFGVIVHYFINMCFSFYIHRRKYILIAELQAEVLGLEEHIRDLQRKLGESSKTDQKKLGSLISCKTNPSTQFQLFYWCMDY